MKVRKGERRKAETKKKENQRTMKNIRAAVMAMVLAGSAGWADDDDGEAVVNAISSSSGVSYKVGRNMYLTDKGLFYEAGRGTYVGRDGVYTRIGKDWITPHGYMTENGGDYFGGGGSSIKIGNDYVRFREDDDSSYNYMAK